MRKQITLKIKYYWGTVNRFIDHSSFNSYAAFYYYLQGRKPFSKMQIEEIIGMCPSITIEELQSLYRG